MPERPELGRVLSIPTFGLTPIGSTGVRGPDRAAAGGQVPLPVKVVRVAIPEGADVRLAPVSAGRRLLMGLKGMGPGSVKESDRGRSDSDAGPTAAPVAGETGPVDAITLETMADSGTAPIRLGEVGYLRFQKFVEVIYTPVVMRPRDGARPQDGAQPEDGAPGDQGLDFDFYPEVEADIIVSDLDPGAAAALSAPAAQPAQPPDDPHFEDTYRAAFVNYDEGRRFRAADRAAGLQTSLVAPGATSPEALLPFAGAATPVYRVFVKDNGIYRLTWSYLLDPNSGVAPGLAGAAPSSFKLMNKGVEVPIRMVDGGDGVFGPGDYVEFYGEGMLGEPKLTLNYHFDPNVVAGANDILQANDVTDENVYFLYGEPGTRARIPDLSAAFGGGAVTNAFFDTIHNEYDTVFVPDGKNDPFYETPALATNANTFTPDPNAVNCGYTNTNGVQKLSNFLGPSTDPNSTSCPACNLNLPPADPNSSTFTATVRAHIRGSSHEATNPDHMTVLQVGTASPASRSTTMCWDDEAVLTQSVSVPQSVVAGGAGVYLGQPGLTTTASLEGLFLDWIEVDYQRALKLTGASLLSHFPNAARSYEMSGFPTSATADMIVYDIGRAVTGSTVPSPRLITGGTVQSDGSGGFLMRYTLPQDTALGPGVEQKFAAAGAGGFRTPLRVTEVVNPDDLTSTTQAADMIVITTPATVGAPPVTQFTDYLSHRASASGLNIKVVYMRDIYDQFNFGIESPQAVKSFLAFAVASWRGPAGTSPAPAYVMLVGDISVDYKNSTGNPMWINQVPTFIMYQPGPFLDYYASDTFMAAVVGSDQLPDVHLGRVSVRNPSEAAVVFQKLLDYDLSPPAGAWRSKGLFLADTGNPGTGEAADFEAFQNSVADNYFVAPFSNQKLYYNESPYFGSSDPNVAAAWRAAYVSAANAGTALTAYTGHGSFDDWGLHGLFNSSYIPLLSANNMPSFLVNEDCLVGGFHALATDSLAENLMKAQGKGIIAAFAPSGLSFGTVFGPINNSLYGDMFGPMKERRLGPLITDVRLALAFSITDMQAYVLLGDPAQRVILPAPLPPGSFAAAGGQDAKVTLSWTASPDPGVLTRIYRRQVFDTVYTLMTPAGVSGISYIDTAVVNGKTYFYRAVSVDPNGPFEGGVTNLGSSCVDLAPATSGADCVWAIPANPNPPSVPSGFRVSNPGTGDRLRVSWNAAAEPDISFYTVHYGTTSGGPYPGSFLIGAPATGGEVPGLVTGTTYYMVVTATNTSNKTSAPTGEGSGIPRVFEGVTPPEIIGDLAVVRSTSFPDSIDLSWTPPATDIYGGPTTLQSIAIFRGTNPFFVPDPNNRIAVLSPTTATYTDHGAFTAPQNWYYLVTATDTQGFVSGASLQLPNGITDLTLTASGGNLMLSWPAVTTDIDGNATLIDHYAVYSDAQPVGRARIETLTPTTPFTTSVALTVPMPAGAMVYYSVIVVDAKQNKSPF